MARLDALMGEPTFRKPIFGSLWRYPEFDALRLQRVGRRGLIRLTLLVPLTLTLVSFLTISVVYATTGIGLLEAGLIGATLASASVVVLRSWMLGTFINGNGFKIVTLLRTYSGRWENIREVERQVSTWRVLGIPIGIGTQRVVIVRRSGGSLATHIYLGSIDGIFTEGRLDMLFQLMLRWNRPE